MHISIIRLDALHVTSNIRERTAGEYTCRNPRMRVRGVRLGLLVLCPHVVHAKEMYAQPIHSRGVFIHLYLATDRRYFLVIRTHSGNEELQSGTVLQPSLHGTH